MPKTRRASRRIAVRPWLWVGVAALVTLALDLWTKHWAWTHLRPPLGAPIMIWDPHLELAFAFNTGTAFSVISVVERPWLFVPLAALAVGWALWVALKTEGGGRLRWLAAGLIAGGALGNLHDRLWRVDILGRHGVVDFIKLNYPWGGSWPTFNLADTALVVGVGLLILTLRRNQDEDEDEDPSSEGGRAIMEA